MTEQFPNQSSEAAREGTASHYVASEILSGRETPKVGSTDPQGVVLTLEMVEGAYVYVEKVKEIAPSGDLTGWGIENPVNAWRIHRECWGTCDLWWSIPGEIHVWDYKFGYGIVEPYENWQLIAYTAGIMDLLKIDGLQDQRTTVFMHIVQPRPFHRLGPHREWRVLAVELRGLVNRLHTAAAEALLPQAVVKSGDHCRYCSARHACLAAQKAGMFAIEYADTAHLEQLSPEALAVELRTMQRAEAAIKYRLTGLEQQAIACIQSGGLVPGYAVDRGTGRTTWTRPAAEVFALGDLMGINLRADPEAITPAAAKKAGLPADVLSAFSKAGDSGVKLVTTDKTTASMVFKS